MSISDAPCWVRVHFTPTYASWLNQVELWFFKIERDLIHRGIVTAVKDLSRRVLHCIDRYNGDPRPVKWRYQKAARRMRHTKNYTVTVH
jgi:hypothetical protein